MNINPRLRCLTLESPLFLCVFAIIPGLFIASLLLHRDLLISTNMVLANAIGLLICVVVRFFYYLLRLRSDIRYGAEPRSASAGQVVPRPISSLQDDLKKAGFRLDSSGRYAELRDYGYLGTLLFYGGLLLVAFTGIHDNLYQFSGTTIHGMGVPLSLDNPKNYFPLIKGPLATPAGLPLLGIERQTFPSKEYPKGATDIILLTKDRKPLLQDKLVAMGGACTFRGFDIFLSKMLIDASLTIKRKENKEKSLFEDAVKLSPLWKKEGIYNYYGTFATSEGHEGDLFFDSNQNIFRIELTKAGNKILDTEYAFQSYRDKTEGDFILSFGGIGRWSELHVVHRRNMDIIWFGGIVAAIGLLMRIVFRPQRIWLEENSEGCRVWAFGRSTKKLLKA